MKEAVGGVFLFNIVIFFILVFTGIMCLTINSSKAYKVKDEIITIIEENNGVNMTSLDQGKSNVTLSEVVDVLTNNSYRATSDCPEGYTEYDRDGELDSNEPSFCLKSTIVDTSEGNDCYFSVVLFYKLDIPFLDKIFTFEVKGETKTLFSSEYCG